MYGKITESWLKHWDFMVIDLLGLQTAYFLSCFARNHWENPYTNDLYLNMAIIIALADICIAFFTEGYQGIMRRGYFQEFKAVFRHVAWILLLQTLYLFLSKRGEEFSRVSFVGYVILSIIILYTSRVLWKRFLMWKCKLVYNKRKILLVTD